MRDEIKRLRATELAVVDDPTAKFPAARAADGRRAGRGSAKRQITSKVHKPGLDEMGIALYHEVAPHRPGGAQKREAPRKPNLDEMGPGIEAIPGKSSGADPRSGPRSTLGRPGMRGGGKPRGRLG
jgi:excinuclease ABC subunit B